MPAQKADHRRRLAPLADAAEYVDCHPRTIRRRIADGSLTGYRMGPRLLRVDLDELDDVLRPVPSAAPREQAAVRNVTRAGAA